MERRKDSKGKVLKTGESQRKDGRYVYQYKDLHGSRRSVYATNLNELRKKEKEIEKKLSMGILDSRMTLNDLFEEYMKHKGNLRNSTRNVYTNRWNYRFKDSIGKMEACNVNKKHILNFLLDMQKNGLSYGTIRNHYMLLLETIDFAIDNDLILKNPCRGCLDQLKKETNKKFSLTVSEQEILLDFVKNDDVYRKYYTMLYLMLCIGTRCGETLALTWKDIDFEKMEISINHQLIYNKVHGKYMLYIDKPKTRSGIRTIPMTTELARVLKEYRIEKMREDKKHYTIIDGYGGFCFTTNKGTPINPVYLDLVLHKIVNKCNKTTKGNECHLPDITPHTLRHTSCTRMAERGIDIKVLQTIMGHADISVTMEIYNHVDESRLHNEMRKMERSFVV